jgi:hypothetical protein
MPIDERRRMRSFRRHSLNIERKLRIPASGSGSSYNEVRSGLCMGTALLQLIAEVYRK